MKDEAHDFLAEFKNDFENIYALALKDWPAEIEFGGLRWSGGTNGSVYSVEGLENIGLTGLDALDVGNKYINTPIEIIMVNIHHAIDIVLHRLAKHCLKIKLADIRPGQVREEFEKAIQVALERDSLGWLENDKELVRQYLSNMAGSRLLC